MHIICIRFRTQKCRSYKIGSTLRIADHMRSEPHSNVLIIFARALLSGQKKILLVHRKINLICLYSQVINQRRINRKFIPFKWNIIKCVSNFERERKGNILELQALDIYILKKNVSRENPCFCFDWFNIFKSEVINQADSFEPSCAMIMSNTFVK